MAKDPDVINADFGGAGSLVTGNLPMLAGLNLVKTNNLPNGNITGTYAGKYDVDATNTAALVWTPEAALTAKLRGLSMHMTGEERRTTHMDTIMTARYLQGHAVGRVECAIEISATAE
jgi:hypothetical protein